MSTTYLDLTNELLRKFGGVQIAEVDFLSVRNTQANAKDFIKRAIDIIHTHHYRWPFNSLVHTQVLTIGENEYSWPSSFRVPDWESFYIVKDDALSSITTPLKSIHRKEWQDNGRSSDYDAGSTGRGLPLKVFKSQGQGFGLTPSPDKAYSVKFNYFRTTPVLTNATDESLIPTDWDHVIIAHASVLMYAFRNNPEERQIQADEAKTLLGQMRSMLVNENENVTSGMIVNSNSSSSGYGV